MNNRGDLLKCWIRVLEKVPPKARMIEVPYSGKTGLRVFNGNASGECPPTWILSYDEKWRYIGRRPIGKFDSISHELEQLRRSLEILESEPT